MMKQVNTILDTLAEKVAMNGFKLTWHLTGGAPSLGLTLAKGDKYRSTIVSQLELRTIPDLALLLDNTVYLMMETLSDFNVPLEIATISKVKTKKGVIKSLPQSLEQLYGEADWAGIMKQDAAVKAKMKPTMTAAQIQDKKDNPGFSLVESKLEKVFASQMAKEIYGKKPNI